MKVVNLIECINFTWQAEGEDAGKKMLLLRFKRCNRAHGYMFEENTKFKACKFCDTLVKMNVQEESEYRISRLQEMIDENNLNVLITGGEPGFGNNLQSTVYIVNLTKAPVYNIETNGCNLEKLIQEVNKNKNVKFVLSPKIFNDYDFEYYKDLVPRIKDNDKVKIKLVYEGTEFNNNFLNFLKDINFNNSRIWLMPEGTTKEDLIKNSPKVFDAAEKFKTNFTSRDHIIYQFV